MTIVDHRVLVNAPPEVAWALLGDLEALPKWHINCTATSMLTTQHEGVGVRRRNTMRGGPDVVEEIISWYPNLGFEYLIVDGPRYRSNRGRVRLQPIPEGTVIQWTFEYQLSGFLSGLRDVFHRRRLDDELARSLKRFKQLVESSGVRMDAATVERVAMRAAPSAAERAAIGEAATRSRQQRVDVPEPTSDRQPSALPKTPSRPMQPVPAPVGASPAEASPVDDDLPPTLPPIAEPPIAEPPLAEDDTRPRPAVGAEPVAVTPDADDDLFDVNALPAWMRPEDDEDIPAIEEATPEPPVVEAPVENAPPPASEAEVPAEIDEHEAETITEAPTRPDREAPAAETPQEETVPATSEDVIATEAAAPAEEPAVEEPPAPEPAIPSDQMPTPPTPMPAVQPPAEPLSRDQMPTPPSTPAVPVEPEQAPAEAAPRPAAPDAALNAREAPAVGPSIWEVFGITPPSGEAPAAAEAAPVPQAAPPSAEEFTPAPITKRRAARRRPAIRVRVFQRTQGLRLRLNKDLARRLQHRIKKAGP